MGGRRFTVAALPLSNHCLPVSLFSLGATRAASGINLEMEREPFSAGGDAGNRPQKICRTLGRALIVLSSNPTATDARRPLLGSFERQLRFISLPPCHEGFHGDGLPMRDNNLKWGRQENRQQGARWGEACAFFRFD